MQIKYKLVYRQVLSRLSRNSELTLIDTIRILRSYGYTALDLEWLEPYMIDSGK
jgi:hypothetical protein